MDQSDPVQRFHEYDAVASDDHHSDVILLLAALHLDSLVNHQVHEGVEPSQDSLQHSVTVQFEGQSFVHVLLELWWGCFRHDECLVVCDGIGYFFLISNNYNFITSLQ